MIIQQIPQNFVHQIWESVREYFEATLQYSYGDYTLDQIRMFLSQGQWTMLVAIEDGKIHGAVSVSFINYPNDRVAFITCIGGRLISNRDTFKQMSEILKAHGATKIQGMARPSIARLWRRYGFEERSMLVETKL